MKTGWIKGLTIVLAIAAGCPSAWADGKTISATEAARHIGESATVCGVVASAKYAEKTKGQPTFLNLDRPYPRQIFTVLTWGSDRQAFGTPEGRIRGKASA